MGQSGSNSMNRGESWIDRESKVMALICWHASRSNVAKSLPRGK